MSWLHCVVSRKNSSTSLRMNSRFATGSAPEQPRGNARPALATHVLLGALLRLGKSRSGTAAGGPARQGPRTRQPCSTTARCGSGSATRLNQFIEDVRRPLARQERARRAPQDAQEVHQVPESLRAAPAAPAAARAACTTTIASRADGHEAQQVARAAGREDVHQHEGDHGADHGRQQEERQSAPIATSRNQGTAV